MSSITKPEVICVDLDGTLVNTDTLFELWLTLLRESVLTTLTSLLSIRRGRWHFRENLAGLAQFKLERLPLNQELLSYLQAEMTSGRRLVLATARH